MSYYSRFGRILYDLNGNIIDENNPPKCHYCYDQGYIPSSYSDGDVDPCPFCDAIERRREMENKNA